VRGIRSHKKTANPGSQQSALQSAPETCTKANDLAGLQIRRDEKKDLTILIRYAKLQANTWTRNTAIKSQ
jgi:hypothetical protein